MALLLIDGFDAYGSASVTGPMKWDALSSFYPLAPGRRAGGRSLTTRASALKYLDPAVADWAFGFAFFWQGGPVIGIAHGLVGGYVGPHSDWQLSVDVMGRLYAQEITLSGPGPTWIATSTLFTCTAALVANAWNYIEVKQVGSTGTVRVNGNTVGTGSLASEAQIGFGLDEDAPYGKPSFDDFYLISIDAETPDFLGDVAILALPVVEDVLAEWTPLRGDMNYPMVDEIPADEDETYNHTDAPDKTDLFALDPATNLDPTLEVLGVQLSVRAEKINTASLDLVPLIVSAGSDAVGPRWGLAVGYGTFIQPLASDPGASGGGVPWTVATMLAASYGYRSLTPAG